jgi:hypothetical protein
MTGDGSRYRPDWAIPPGETVFETLAALGLSQDDLARRTGVPLETLRGIIQGTAAGRIGDKLGFGVTADVRSPFLGGFLASDDERHKRAGARERR